MKSSEIIDLARISHQIKSLESQIRNLQSKVYELEQILDHYSEQQDELQARAAGGK